MSWLCYSQGKLLQEGSMWRNPFSAKGWNLIGTEQRGHPPFRKTSQKKTLKKICFEAATLSWQIDWVIQKGEILIVNRYRGSSGKALPGIMECLCKHLESYFCRTKIAGVKLVLKGFYLIKTDLKGKQLKLPGNDLQLIKTKLDSAYLWGGSSAGLSTDELVLSALL